MRLANFRKKPRPQTANGIICTTSELLELRHKAGSLLGHSSRKAYSIMSGSMLSRFRGRGMDYAESRIYTPGDDIRSIDWKVTARSDKPYTKLYMEERDHPIMTLVDFSPSLYFGTKEAFKSVIAARLAATIAWTAALNSDRIGGILLTTKERFDLRPKGGRKGVLALINALAKATEHTPDKNSDAFLEQILHHAGRTIRPGSRIFLISDFYNFNSTVEQSLSRLRRHNDLVLCQIIDPLELEAPAPGIYNISDGEKRARLNTRTADRRQAYIAKFNEQREKLNRVAANLKVPYLKIVSGSDITGVMRRGLNLKRSGTRV